MQHLNSLAWRHDPRGLALSFYKVSKHRTDLRTAEINKRWQGCVGKWFSLHCPHDGVQNRCPTCGCRPAPISVDD